MARTTAAIRAATRTITVISAASSRPGGPSGRRSATRTGRRSDSSTSSAVRARDDPGGRFGSTLACSPRAATASPTYSCRGSRPRARTVTATTAASSRNVSPKVSNARVPYTISLTGLVVLQAGSATASARWAIAGSGASSRCTRTNATGSRAATPPASPAAIHGRCSGSRSLLMAPLALFAELLTVGHVRAGLADRDQVQHRERDRPDDHLRVRDVWRTEQHEQQRQHGADGGERHHRAAQVAQLHDEHRRSEDPGQAQVVEYPEPDHRCLGSSRTAPRHIGTPAL